MKLPRKLFGMDVVEEYEKYLAGAKDVKEPAKENKIIIPTNIQNPESYLILEGKTHGPYSYPDLLVSMHRLGLDNQVKQIAKQLNVTVQNTAKEKDGTEYIGSIKWEPAIKLTLGLNGFTLNPRQYVDFINLLKSGKAHNGSGDKVDKKVLDSILDEILTVRNPYRAEWLDADFKILDKKGNIVDAGKGEFYLLSSHTLQNGVLVPNYKANIEGKYLNKDSETDINSFNEFGLATKEGNDFWQWYPRKDNNSVARVRSDSDRAYLDCDRNPALSYSALGVRLARKK